jgi:hypothetical protein
MRLRIERMAGVNLSDVFAYYPSTEPYASKPWRFGQWLVATQGHLLVAVADDGRDADSIPDRFKKAEHYLTASLQDAVAVPFAELRKFAGVVCPAFVECEECEGSGRGYGDEFACEHCGKDTRPPCHSCGGDGRQGIVRKFGKVAGVAVNRTLLAFGLSVVPERLNVSVGPIVALRTTQPATSALAVVADGWRVVLMPCLDVPADAPTFCEPSGVAL